MISEDIFGYHNLGGGRMLLASSGWKPGILLDTLQSTEQHSQQKLIQSKMSTVPWLRNFGTDSFFFFFNQSETWLWVWLGNLLFLPMSPGVLWSPTLIFLSPAWFLSPEITMSCMPLSWNGHLGCFFFFFNPALGFYELQCVPHTHQCIVVGQDQATSFKGSESMISADAGRSY